MALDFTRYVDIISGVAGASQIGERQLIGRIFSANRRFAPGPIYEFTKADAVASYLGQALTGNTDAARAAMYFGFISKIITAPKRLGYQFYSLTNTAPIVFGSDEGDFTVADWQSITNGDLTLTMGAFSYHLTGLNFSSVTTLADVATIVQTAIQAQTGGGGLWTAATVAYSTSNPQGNGFNLTGGATGAATISVTAGTVNDVASKLGWLTGAIYSAGIDAQTYTQILTQSYAISNNFGSFQFDNDLNQDIDDKVEIATWNKNKNNRLMYLTSTNDDVGTDATPLALQVALASIGGVGITLRPSGTAASQFPHMLPMCVLAATDYTRDNAAQNYEYQQSSFLTAGVSDDAVADTYDAVGINYYGVTQENGNLISFYQTGVLQGLATDATDMGVYANEIWLKAAMETACGNLLLSQGQVPVDNIGLAMLYSTSQPVINQAVRNGTMTKGKPFSPEQIVTINQITNDLNAWRQVQNQGYWIRWTFQPYTVNSVTKYKAVYLLVYSKGDSIRKIEGTDTLI